MSSRVLAPQLIAMASDWGYSAIVEAVADMLQHGPEVDRRDDDQIQEDQKAAAILYDAARKMGPL